MLVMSLTSLAAVLVLANRLAFMEPKETFVPMPYDPEDPTPRPRLLADEVETSYTALLADRPILWSIAALPSRSLST